MKLQSDFAILDVMWGRKHLSRVLTDGATGGPSSKRVPVVIHGSIIGQWGSDDGTSIEFTVRVTKVEAGDPEQ